MKQDEARRAEAELLLAIQKTHVNEDEPSSSDKSLNVKGEEIYSIY